MHIHDPSVPAPSDPSIIESNGNGNLNLNLTNSTSTSVFHRSLTDIPTRAVRAEGNYIYRESGQKVLDACGGAAVISIGHADQRVIAGLVQQMNTVGYVHSGAWANDASEELADRLCKSAGMARCVFTSGGSEAVESAIKLARQYHLESGSAERINFIAREQSYHGNTLGALALGGHKRRRAPYEPLLSSTFHRVSPCYAYRYKLENETDAQYVARLKQELEEKFIELGPETVAAFVAEPVVGATTGCVPSVPGYFPAMREVCDKYGALFICDEIMSGIGRTGKMHAWQWEGISAPDIQVVGKGLTGGYAPCAAVLCSARIISAFESGSGAFTNGYTFQSWAIGARAANEVLKIIEEEGLVEQCRARGELLEKELTRVVGGHPNVGDIRGRGLFYGIELVLSRSTKAPFPVSFPLTTLLDAEMIKRGVVIYPGMKGTADGISGDHMLISPPYTISEEEVCKVASAFGESLEVVMGVWEREKAAHL